MAHAQVASRRRSEDYIRQNRVKVNGKLINEPGYIVKDGDLVELDGRVIEIKDKLDYYVLNKPIGVISSASDDLKRPGVTDLIKTSKRLYPVGRLDKDSTGLIILTNDGNLTQILSHPSYEIEKTYRVRVQGKLDEKHLEKIRQGVLIQGYKTKPARIRLLKSSNRPLVEIKIKEGKNRQIRKMFDALGFQVLDLHRIQFGQIYLGSLGLGSYRKFTKRELDYIKSLRDQYGQ